MAQVTTVTGRRLLGHSQDYQPGLGRAGMRAAVKSIHRMASGAPPPHEVLEVTGHSGRFVAVVTLYPVARASAIVRSSGDGI